MTESDCFVRGKIYAVARGRQIGLFDTCKEVMPMVEGVSDAVPHSFYTTEEAKELLWMRLREFHIAAQARDRTRM